MCELSNPVREKLEEDDIPSLLLISHSFNNKASRMKKAEAVTDFQSVKKLISFPWVIWSVHEHVFRLKPEIVAAGRTLTQQHSQLLLKPVTKDEIRHSLFSIGNDKSPGPDGYSACFFKHSWEIIEEDFCEAVLEFFHTGQLLRLSEVLVDVIDPAQAAFLKGRSMAENIFLLQELLRQYERKKISPRCILNVDIRKAFDTVDWHFIQSMLEAMKFPSIFITWIMACISTTSYSMVINGTMNGFITGKRGLRQGDPLSPYLFVLCLEYLSRSLNLLQENEDFNFHPKCKGLRITHLAFADDLVLFARGDPLSVSLVMGKLNHFGSCSGLQSSISKSTVLAAGIPRDDLNMIYSSTGFKQGSFPFRYLGVPVAATRLTIAQYSPLIDKIAEYIDTWTGATLYYAGRLELINSVLQGMVSFWSAILPIPSGVYSKITQFCRNYLWGGKSMVHKFPLVAWKEVVLPKSEGGLGIRH